MNLNIYMVISIIGILFMSLLFIFLLIFRNNIAKIREKLQYMEKTIISAQGEDMRVMANNMEFISRQINHGNLEVEQKLENIRTTLFKSVGEMSRENSRQLELMRGTVEEKLETTLNERITQSFQLVNERLEQVYKGLGEMQTLASGVGDLKKVLLNVKTRGIIGEIQLGSILSDMMSPNQYRENIATKQGSNDRVEFAVKMPGKGDEEVFLPIDAKFPATVYEKLMSAYESGDSRLVKIASSELKSRIRQEAKDISTKYLDPPFTTDFAIMFLPFEGLYAEVIRLGMIEELQRTYNIIIAGPTTMAVILNSLQMGFKTLAIERHSNEVWKILGSVKTEFENFERVLSKTKERLDQAGDELDRLVGVRTRAIQKKLEKVMSVEDDVERDYIE